MKEKEDKDPKIKEQRDSSKNRKDEIMKTKKQNTESLKKLDVPQEDVQGVSKNEIKEP